MHRVRSNQEDDAVLAAGGAFAGNHANLSVGRNADVVDEPRVDFKWIGGLPMCGIRVILNIDPVPYGAEICPVGPAPLPRKQFFLPRPLARHLRFSVPLVSA